jgi:hypothetical protein
MRPKTAERRIPEDTLRRLRSLPCERVLDALGLSVYFKRDPDFKPKADPETAKFHVHGPKFEGDMIATGPKFFCPAKGKGGCGGVDLVMLLEGCTFKGAVMRLREALDA